MIEIKAPDLNAPRFRSTKYNVLDENLLKRFREKFPQYKDIPDSKLREIIKAYNEALWNVGISYRDGQELPEGLGYLFIGSCPKQKSFDTNYPESTKNGVLTKFQNYESDNYLAKIFYTNFANKYHFQNRQLWSFKGCRNFTRGASEAYRADFKKYLAVDDLTHVSKVFKESKKGAWLAKKIEQEIVAEYNEFDMN